MQVDHQETFERWLTVGVPLLIGLGASAVAILHASTNLQLGQTIRMVGVFVLIQLAIYVPMFWIRRRFRHTRDPRLAITLFGAYCLVMGIVAIHYGTELKLMSFQRSEYATFSIVVIVATLILVAVSPKWKNE
jgi:FtsH-binding integral membrane protein